MPVALKSKSDAIVISSKLRGGAIPALSQLMSNPDTAATPVVVVTDQGQQEQDLLLKAGAAKCVGYPLKPAAIIAEIEKQFKLSVAPKLAPATSTLDPTRLQALHDSDLLDSPPEEVFDELTSLAAQLLGVPTALMSLVDSHRQFFKSQAGLGEPWSSARETPLSHSFCQWVVSSKENLVVFDAKQHPVLCNNSAVKDLGVSAYAGVPLIAEPGHVIGAFCVVDSEPKQWTAEEIETLEDLTQIVNAYIGLRQVLDDSETDLSAQSTAAAMTASSSALSAATRLLARVGTELGEEEIALLRSIVEKYSQRLLKLTNKQ